MKRYLARVESFFLTPASAKPLAALRIAIAAVLLLQAWMLHSSVSDFFTNDGIVQGDLAQYITTPGTPKLSHLIHWLAPLHLSETAGIGLICRTYVFSLILLGIGVLTPLMAAFSWFLHWVLMNTSETTSYGVDLYAHVVLFYLIFVPSGNTLSTGAWLRGVPEEPTSGARLGLRVLQLHLCISYLCSAVEKAQGIQWWNGELLWRALSLPVYRQFDMSWLAHWPWLSTIAGIASLFLELGYCVFIWPRKTRSFWIAGIVGMHLGIALFLGLHLFGIVMALLTPILFGISAEPRRSVRSDQFVPAVTIAA